MKILYKLLAKKFKTNYNLHLTFMTILVIYSLNKKNYTIARNFLVLILKLIKKIKVLLINQKI